MSIDEAQKHFQSASDVATNALRALDGMAGAEYDAARALAISLQEIALGLGHLAESTRDKPGAWSGAITPPVDLSQDDEESQISSGGISGPFADENGHELPPGDFGTGYDGQPIR
jgi:hypothetical protein